MLHVKHADFVSPIGWVTLGKTKQDRRPSLERGPGRCNPARSTQLDAARGM